MTHNRLYLIAYDVPCPRRRARVLRAVKAHGVDGQKSAHECALTRRAYRDLRRSLDRVMDRRADRLLVLRLDPRSPIDGLGIARPATPDWFYIG